MKTRFGATLAMLAGIGVGAFAVQAIHAVATGTLRRWLQKPENMVAYVEHVRNLIRRHVACDQKALVVCVKPVVEAKVPDWSEHMAPFFNRSTERPPATPFAWDMEGRQIAVTWYGGYGIGANDWREADVVLLFDDFHLPKRTQIATLQGLMGHNADEGFLMNGSGAAEQLQHLADGHVLRWLKQMAMRGRGRELDHHGVCNTQKLVVTGDLVRLLKHRNQLFPGARLYIERYPNETLVQRLIHVLTEAPESHEVSTRIIAERLGDTWRNISGNLRKAKGWTHAVEGIGWTYHPGSGSKLGCFRRGAVATRVVAGDQRQAMARIAAILRQKPSVLCGHGQIPNPEVQQAMLGIATLLRKRAYSLSGK